MATALCAHLGLRLSVSQSYLSVVVAVIIIKVQFFKVTAPKRLWDREGERER
jgi:hypothetical protein